MAECSGGERPVRQGTQAAAVCVPAPVCGRHVAAALPCRSRAPYVAVTRRGKYLKERFSICAKHSIPKPFVLFASFAGSNPGMSIKGDCAVACRAISLRRGASARRRSRLDPEVVASAKAKDGEQEPRVSRTGPIGGCEAGNSRSAVSGTGGAERSVGGAIRMRQNFSLLIPSQKETNGGPRSKNHSQFRCYKREYKQPGE